MKIAIPVYLGLLLLNICTGAYAQEDNIIILPDILTLDTAKAIALEHNPSLGAAEANIAEAEERVRQAWASYFPSVDVSLSASKTKLSDSDYKAARDGAFQGSFMGLQSQLQSALFGGLLPPVENLIQQGIQSTATGLYARSQIDDTVDNYSAGISLTWLLFDGFRREFASASARIGEENSRSAYDESKRLILSAVAGSYFNAQLARERITIAEADREFNEQQLREAKAKRRVGTGSLSDELNFEIRVNAAEDTLIKAEMQYKIAMIGLAALLGLPDPDMPENIDLEELAVETAQELEAPDVEAMIELAVENRPDLQQAKYMAQLAEANVGIQKSVFYPMVSGVASRNAIGTRNMGFDEDDFSTTIGINVSLNLFSGGRDKARLREAKAAHVSVKRILGYTEIQIKSEVRQAITSLDSARKSLLLQRKNADNTQQNRDLVEKGYKAGQTSLVRLNQAQLDLVQADANLALARVALRQAWHNLETATAQTISQETE